MGASLEHLAFFAALTCFGCTPTLDTDSSETVASTSPAPVLSASAPVVPRPDPGPPPLDPSIPRYRAPVGHQEPITALSFDPQSRLLASGALSGEISLWDLPSGRWRTLLRQRDNDGSGALAFSPDGTRLANMGTNRIDVFPMDPTGSSLRMEAEAGNVFLAVRWEDDTNLLALSSAGTFRRWNLPADRSTTVWRTTDQGEFPVQTAALSPDGKTVAVAYRTSDELHLLDATTGASRKKLPVRDVDTLAISPDGKTLAVLRDRSRSIQRFDARTGASLGSSPISTEYVKGLVWNPNSRQIAVVEFDDRSSGTISLVGVKSRTLRTQTSRMSTANTAAYSADGSQVAVGDYVGRIHLFRSDSGALATRISPQPRGFGAIACSPSASSIVSGGQMLLWDLSQRTVRQLVPGYHDVQALVWLTSPDRLVGVESAGRVVEWDLDGKELRTIRLVDWKLDQNNARVVMSARGNVVASRVGTAIGVWSAASGKRTAYLEKPFGAHAPTGLSLSPAGDRIAILGFDAISIVDTATGEVTRRLATRSRAPRITAVVGENAHWSEDGSLLFVGSPSFLKVDVWDTHKGKLVRTLESVSPTSGFTLSPDGRLLATSSGSIVDVSKDAVVRSVETRAVAFGRGADLSDSGACWISSSRAVALSQYGGLRVWFSAGEDRHFVLLEETADLRPFVLDGKGGFDGPDELFPAMAFELGGRRLTASDLARDHRRPGLAWAP